MERIEYCKYCGEKYDYYRREESEFCSNACARKYAEEQYAKKLAYEEALDKDWEKRNKIEEENLKKNRHAQRRLKKITIPCLV